MSYGSEGVAKPVRAIRFESSDEKKEELAPAPGRQMRTLQQIAAEVSAFNRMERAEGEGALPAGASEQAQEELLHVKNVRKVWSRRDTGSSARSGGSGQAFSVESNAAPVGFAPQRNFAAAT